jgi:hypothetical protein
MENTVSIVDDVTAYARVFTELLLRNGLHNPVFPWLLGADYIENTASSLVACWTAFTKIFPGKAVFKSVTIYIYIYIYIYVCVCVCVCSNIHNQSWISYRLILVPEANCRTMIRYFLWRLITTLLTSKWFFIFEFPLNRCILHTIHYDSFQQTLQTPVSNSLLLVLILSYRSAIHTLPPCFFFKIHSNIILSSTPGFPFRISGQNLHKFLFFISLTLTNLLIR